MLKLRKLLTVWERRPELKKCPGPLGFQDRVVLSRYSRHMLDCNCVFTLFMLLKAFSTTAVDNGQIRISQAEESATVICMASEDGNTWKMDANT